MSRRRAPTAIRNPISRVRSVTDTSMMFMMLMPPTIWKPTRLPLEETAVRTAPSRALKTSDALDVEVIGRLQAIDVAAGQRLHAVLHIPAARPRR